MSKEAEPECAMKLAAVWTGSLFMSTLMLLHVQKKKERKQNRRTLNVPKVVSSNFSANNVK